MSVTRMCPGRTARPRRQREAKSTDHRFAPVSVPGGPHAIHLGSCRANVRGPTSNQVGIVRGLAVPCYWA